MGPTADQDGYRKSHPDCGANPPECPAPSELLYQLHYPGHQLGIKWNTNDVLSKEHTLMILEREMTLVQVYLLPSIACTVTPIPFVLGAAHAHTSNKIEIRVCIMVFLHMFSYYTMTLFVSPVNTTAIKKQKHTQFHLTTLSQLSILKL